MRISCSTMGLCKTLNIFGAIKAIKDAGFDGVDLSLNLFSGQDGALYNDKWWRQWVQAVAAYAQELALPVVQAHASWEQSIPEDGRYHPPYNIYERTLEACRLLSCDKLVFHPLLCISSTDGAVQTERIEAYNLQWFRALQPAAQAAGVRIELENLFNYFHPGSNSFCYSEAEPLLTLARQVSAGICLDTGHASISGQEVPQLIRKLGKQLECLHLNDNFGYIPGKFSDLHLLPGDGRLNWQEIFTALREVGYSGTLNLEPAARLPYLSEQARQQQLCAGRKTIEKMVESSVF